jgi:hypothetical protein
MSLRDEIQYAFAKTPYPGDDALTSCACEECQYSVRRFRGKKWSRLTLADVGDDQGNVASLTPPAFHYFLPGLLLLVLDQGEQSGSLLHSIADRFAIGDLNVDRNKDGITRVGKMIQRLSHRQRQALADFFRYFESTPLYVPEVMYSAIGNLLSGEVRPYSHRAFEQWLARTYGWKIRL